MTTGGLRCRDPFHPSDHEVADIPTQHVRSGGRFPCFDGLRALAALSVVGVHTAFVSGLTGRSWLGHYTARLEIGVSVFFVISGFLLYRPFAVAHLGGRPANAIWTFWARRLRRIIPAYWLAFLAITYVFGVGTVRHDWWSPLVYLGFAQIYLPHYVLTGVTQAWSLCTEMSFYLMLPLWAALVARVAGKQAESEAGVARRARRRRGTDRCG